MGCDIHMVLEVKHNDNWLGYDGRCKDATRRNYDLFGELAGVRVDTPTALEPRGIPTDASTLTLMEYEGWELDAHTPSWVTMREYVDAVKRTLTPAQRAAEVADRLEGGPMAVDNLICERFGVWNEDEVEYRIVFWFDN